ncbi:MHFG family PEP-CTERM protein [Paucibacter sp. KBW04]|uniref:MHFG family PEP-CTERM protein n=1 Tax=Paucibacter sp. KBW04 TaxID=2153361 RepID=UPI0021070410|nr:MHFG family PEP-CTERM protein [Paucibacter sp. KBW04]
MSLLATLALAASGAASGAVLPHCSWDKPGVNPFMGDVVAAVDRYTDIPVAVRERLKERMKKRDYDELVSIQRDGIKGKAQYGADIRDMHFGANNVCKTVSRAKWTQKAEERGLVYCEENQCILVPTVCRNVSRINRVPGRAAAPGGAQNVASSAQDMVEPQTPLDMEPTGAGPLSTPNSPGSFAQVAGGGSGLDGLPGTTPGGGTIFPGGGGTGGPGIGPIVVPSLPPGTTTPPVIPPVTPGVPEPETWALMLGGLLAVGFLSSRRKKA